MTESINPDRQHIVLVGLSGSGKSTTARIVASRLGWSAVDTDALIEQAEGCPITEIFAERGEQAFREIESLVVTRAVKGPQAVIATGGGAILLENNREQLWSRGFVVYLRTSPAKLVQRLAAHGADDRPLLQGDLQARLESLLRARSKYYEQAHAVVDTDQAAPETIAEMIVQAYERSH